MSSKRQQTFAKMERERRVKDKRAQKLEKKAAAAAARIAEADGTLSVDAVDQDGAPVDPDEAPVDPDEAPDAPLTDAPSER
jgi:hypothetical protein